MKERLEEVSQLLVDYLKDVIKNRTTPAEVESISEVARVLIELTIQQSMM